MDIRHGRDRVLPLPLQARGALEESVKGHDVGGEDDEGRVGGAIVLGDFSLSAVGRWIGEIQTFLAVCLDLMLDRKVQIFRLHFYVSSQSSEIPSFATDSKCLTTRDSSLILVTLNGRSFASFHHPEALCLKASTFHFNHTQLPWPYVQ